MHKEKWVFYTDLFGSQRWERTDAAGLTISESRTGFATLAEALADASLHGYRPGDDGTACDLGWHRKAVSPVSVPDHSLEELEFVLIR
jgi:hypothetical protein